MHTPPPTAAAVAADAKDPPHFGARYVVRLSGALAVLCSQGGEVLYYEDEVLGKLRAETQDLAAASVLAVLLRPGGVGRGGTAYDDEVLDRLREAGMMTYPSPLLGSFREQLPDVFAVEVLGRT